MLTDSISSPLAANLPRVVTRRQVSIVIPTFNSGAYLAGTVDRARAFFRQHDLDGEVIVADDGSTDGTADTIAPAPDVHVLRLRHSGKGAALRAGVATAGGEVVAFTDADLPYGMHPLPLALTCIQERRYHAVVGDRTLPGSQFERPSLFRATVSEVASFAFRTLVTGGIYDTQCGFKVFQGDVARELFRLSRVDGFAVDVELIYLLLKYRLDIKRIPVQLEHNAPSTVRVVRDSAAAVRDIGRIRLRWASGGYHSSLLIALLQQELRRDVEIAAAGVPRAAQATPGQRLAPAHHAPAREAGGAQGIATPVLAGGRREA